MKRFLVFVGILCVVFLLYAGAQEKTTEFVEPTVAEEPSKLPDTRLNVTIIDGLNDTMIKLKNCRILVKGDLYIAEDLFHYANTFIEGDRYEIVISIRAKK